MPSSVKRNLRLYPWYAALLHAHFWFPVFFLYFNSKFSLAEVLRLEAIYYAAIVLFEVPSGYFSDVAGRRATLLIANAGLLVAYVLFLFGTAYPSFVLAQVALAIGLAFNSGTDTSLHYESLASIGRQSEFDDREASVSGYTFIAGAVAALAGGGIAMLDLRLAYGLSAVSALICFCLVVGMKEPNAELEENEERNSFTKQLVECGRLLRRPALRWLFLFFVLMVVLNHVPYEFYQPYVALQGGALNLPDSSVPGISGVMTAIPMLLASVVAARSIRFRNRVGLAPALLGATALQTAIIATMAFVLHPLVFVLILLRTCPRAIMTAPVNAAIAPQVPQRLRATFFSLQSFAGRLSFSGLLVVLSLVVGDGRDDGAGIARSLTIAAAVGILGFAVLAVTSTALHRVPESSE